MTVVKETAKAIKVVEDVKVSSGMWSIRAD
jgi:hypothetical protein